jgi:uroporphyrinogen decarboxylase
MSYKNEILLDVFKHKAIERPPVWVMRQAGRILPGYRSVRASVSGFKELVKNPELIAQVTVEPLDVLGVDAAILFSDILVIPEAMGLDYDIIEKKGPRFSKVIKSSSDIDQLTWGNDVLPELKYVFDSIKTTKDAIDDRNPLIGFSGAPWTLFAYMIEGSGSKTFAKARRFLYEQPKESHRLMQKITDSIIAYLQEKIRCGVDVVQLFDSWADMLPIDQYRTFALPYVEQIFASIDEVPKIFFPKGAWSMVPYFKDLAIDALGIDWTTPPEYVRSHLGENIILQGNMDPCQLYAPIIDVERKTTEVINSFGRNHIFNLGHGVYPDTSYEHVQAMIRTIKAYRYK